MYVYVRERNTETGRESVTEKHRENTPSLWTLPVNECMLSCQLITFQRNKLSKLKISTQVFHPKRMPFIFHFSSLVGASHLDILGQREE